MASVTFPTEYGGDGKTYTDDADPTTGLDGTGYITRFVPTLAGSVAMAAHATQKADEADQSAQSASASAQQANEDRDSINLDLQTLNGLVADAQGSADAAASSATTASNLADAVAEATATYTSISAGLADTVDTNYFRVIEAPEATRVSVYRNDSGSATPITTYYTKTGVDAKQAAAVRLNRSLQRLGDHGQTLHSDFNLAAYGLGTPLCGGVQDALETAEGIWETERLSGSLALQHVADGSLKYVYVPPNVIAREYNPATGQYQAQDYGVLTNHFFYSGGDFSEYLSKLGTATATYDALAETPLGVGAVEINAPSFNDRVERNFPSVAPLASDSFCQSYEMRAKSGTASARIFIRAGTVVATKDISLTERWQRVDVYSDGGDSTARLVAIYNTTGAVLVTAPQLVQGTTPGPVIVTEDAPVTRAADNISRTLGAEFNASEGTIVVEFNDVTLRSGGATAQVFGLFDAADDTPRLIVECLPTVALRRSGDVGLPSTLSFGSAYSGDRGMVGFSWDANGYRLAFNGQVNESGTPIEGIDLLSRIAPLFGYGNSINGSNGGCSLLTLTHRALTATELQELTTL